MKLYYKSTTATRMIYKFEFSILDNRSSISVYSFDLAEIILFINQHSFVYEDCKNFIQEIEFTEQIEKRFEENKLRLYVFKSNSSNDEISIMTTEFIMEKCITNIGEKLTNACWFGSLILNKQHPLLPILNDMIEELPFVSIMDYQSIIDDSTSIEFNEPDYNKDIIKEEIWRSSLNNIGNDSSHEFIQTITLDAYISNFASLV